MTGQNSINIETNEQRIVVNNDPARVLVFNPSDLVFAERFYALKEELTLWNINIKKQYERLDAEKGKDESGVPLNVGERLSITRQACEDLRAKIDGLFGAGTSQLVFGDALVPDTFVQFFKQITPFIQSARAEKMEPYTKKRNRHPGQTQ